MSNEYGKVPLGYATYKIPQSDESVEIRDESAVFFSRQASPGENCRKTVIINPLLLREGQTTKSSPRIADHHNTTRAPPRFLTLVGAGARLSVLVEDRLWSPLMNGQT
jgi:hypothetical protein